MKNHQTFSLKYSAKWGYVGNNWQEKSNFVVRLDKKNNKQKIELI